MNVEKYIENISQNASDISLINVLKMNNYYYDEFIHILMEFNKRLSNHQIMNLLNKFNLNKPFDNYSYIQHASELAVLKYIIDKFDRDFLYEPTYDSPKNPECSFKYNDKIINIEVKCPNYKKRDQQQNTNAINVMIPERFYSKEKIDELCKIDGFELLSLLDNKLKDFIEDSHKKFPTVSNNYFNILLISLPSLCDIDEWYVYLFGDKGIFSKNSFIKKDLTNNIHAFVLSDVAKKHTLRSFNFQGNWKLDDCINLFLPNPEIDKSNLSAKEFYWKNALDMFGGFTRRYHEYILKMDKISEQDWRKVKSGEMSLETYNFIHQTNRYMFISNLVKQL